MIRAAVLLLLLLTGCSLHPLYAGGSDGAVASTLRTIAVAPIEGRNGWLMRNALTDRLGSNDSGALYRLDVEIDDAIEGFGVRRDDAVTRERRTLRTRYRLIDRANGAVVLDATAGSDVGIDVVSSDYGTIAAENSALERLVQIVADQMIGRIALYTQRTPPKP